MDLSNPRFHSKRINWAAIIADGYDPKTVMLEAQKQGFHKLAHSAAHRLSNQKTSETKPDLLVGFVEADQDPTPHRKQENRLPNRGRQKRACSAPHLHRLTVGFG